MSLFVLISYTGLCQSGAVYPDFMSAYFFNMAPINVAYIPSDGIADFAVGYKFREGQLKKVSTLSFAGSRIFRSKKGNAQAIRVLGNNEQTGPYISSPKGYFNYAYGAKLAEETYLSGGIALGLAGVYYSAPTFSSSLWMPDGSLGIDFRYRTLSLGASALQVLNSQSSHAGETYRLGRFYHLYASIEKEIGLDWKCKSYLIWRNLDYAEDEVGFALSITAKEVFTLGSVLRYQSGASFFTAFHLTERDNVLLLSLTYNAAPLFTSLPSWQNSFEIGLGYIIQ